MTKRHIYIWSDDITPEQKEAIYKKTKPKKPKKPKKPTKKPFVPKPKKKKY